MTFRKERAVTTSGQLRELLPAIAEREHVAPESYPKASVRDLYEAGAVAAPFPVSLGGSGWRLTDAVAAVEAIAGASPSTALIVSMPLGLAGVFGLGVEIAPTSWRPAWAAQIEKVAADYKQGLIYAACNSEKGAGGSLEATQTLARRGEDGRFRLTGEKILASSGRHANTFFSMAKVSQDDLPGAGIVELFFVQVGSPGVEILEDWDGFGMRSTESQTVRYMDAPVRDLAGFPNFLSVVQPLQYWYCLFAAIPLGCARTVLTALGTPAPQSAALRMRLSDAAMRYEAMRAYLLETAAGFHPAAGPRYAARVLRAKTYVTQEATKLCAELFALGGGRNYRRTNRIARTLADSFAGTSLRPPLPLALDMLVENFTLDAIGE
jgi:alkylation response protein AidB-like acyl-CoA dehydrogenase